MSHLRSFVALLAIASSAAADPPLTGPARVTGRTSRLVVINAETPATTVRWHACPGPDRPDLWPAPDGKTLLFCVPMPGTYELWAWTAVNGEPTEAVGVTVVIETPEPPPAPDAFPAALKAAWD